MRWCLSIIKFNLLCQIEYGMNENSLSFHKKGAMNGKFIVEMS